MVDGAVAHPTHEGLRVDRQSVHRSCGSWVVQIMSNLYERGGVLCVRPSTDSSLKLTLPLE